MSAYVCGLEFCSVEFETGCDGCGRKIPAGELHVGNIDSCCGGCTRALCSECAEIAGEMARNGIPVKQEAQVSTG